MNTSSKDQYEMWQQWATTAAPAKRCTSNLLDDDENDETVEQHMQIPGMSPAMTASDSAFLPPLTGLARGGNLIPTESGALPTVSLRRCNHS